MTMEALVADYFALGRETWFATYRGALPEGASPESFVVGVRSTGRELLFVDRPWKEGPQTGVHAYLLFDASTREYVLYSVDRATAMIEGRFASLGDAMGAKAQLLLRLLGDEPSS